MRTSKAWQLAEGHSREDCSAVAGHVATWLMGQAAPAPGWHSQLGVMVVCPGTPPIHPAPSPVVSALRARCATYRQYMMEMASHAQPGCTGGTVQRLS